MAQNCIKKFTVGGFDYELNEVRCGKANCTKCPHGPYWYMTMNLRDGRKVKKYVGKELPEGVEEP